MAPTKRKAPAKAEPAKPARASRQRTSKGVASATAAAAVPAKPKRAARAKPAAAKARAAAAPKVALRKAAAPKRGASGKTKATSAAAAAAAAPPNAVQPPSSGGKRAVDEFCAQTGVGVVKGYDATLNQTNLGVNANKFYRLQMLQQTTGAGFYLVWTRWGRVGVPGQSKMLGPFGSEEAALREFEGKFKAKTGTAWQSRATIEHKVGKYCPVDIDPDAKPAQEKPKSPAKAVKYKPSTLDQPTQDLISLIFDDLMFTSAMKDFEIDVEKFPLGQLSASQVKKGHAVLEELKAALKKRAATKVLEQLTSKFYTVIPHAFGFKRPPTLSTLAAVNAKVDMCNVLTDIEIAQSMLGGREASEQEEEEEPEQPHPADEKYKLLDAQLELLADDDSDGHVIDQYIRATVGRWTVNKAHVWRVSRNGEAERFAAHSGLDNRRLLWHGTNVAVVAAVLKTGLRIMPHSGGRVGRGIYLASEQSKSCAYVRYGRLKGKKVGVMFLAEAALGKEHHITQDDSSLTAAPKGYDCVVARGLVEPDPKLDAEIKLDGRIVSVPQGPPVPQPKYKGSSFTQSEYLLYQESQAALRYVVTFDFK